MRRFVVVASLAAAFASPASAQLGGILSAPATLIQRAVEARSSSDIAKDNEIAVKVNAVMAKLGTIKASTEIYEQRLLVTGLFDDKATYDQFEQGVRAVKGVKKLYWQVAYLAKDDPKRQSLPEWTDTVERGTKAQARLIGTAGVADVNFRTTMDSFGTLYVLGRARSSEEAAKAVARLKDGDGVKKVVSYIEVRP